jgi:hypothetical protein
LGERGYSDRDTARLLKIMADATGGKACVRTGEAWTGIACTNAIADKIMSDARASRQ